MTRAYVIRLVTLAASSAFRFTTGASYWRWYASAEGASA